MRPPDWSLFLLLPHKKTRGEVCCSEDTQDPGGISWGIFSVTKVIRGFMALPWTIRPSTFVIFWKWIRFSLVTFKLCTLNPAGLPDWNQDQNMTKKQLKQPRVKVDVSFLPETKRIAVEKWMVGSWKMKNHRNHIWETTTYPPWN